MTAKIETFFFTKTINKDYQPRIFVKGSPFKTLRCKVGSKHPQYLIYISQICRHINNQEEGQKHLSVIILFFFQKKHSNSILRFKSTKSFTSLYLELVNRYLKSSSRGKRSITILFFFQNIRIKFLNLNPQKPSPFFIWNRLTA